VAAVLTVEFFQTPAGNKPVADYMRALDSRERERLTAVFRRIQTEGLAAVTTRPVERDLWEIKAGMHRTFYAVVVARTVTILHAYKKQGQRAPLADLQVARQRLAEFKARMSK
jgi:phage-related protein